MSDVIGVPRKLGTKQSFSSMAVLKTILRMIEDSITSS